MFGVAVWAQRTRRSAPRTRSLGQENLSSNAQQGNRLIFGSEIKAILAAVPELAEPDPQAIVPYFRQGFISEPDTCFRGIRKLPAAHCSPIKMVKPRLVGYWQLKFQESAGADRPAGEVVEELTPSLRKVSAFG